MVLDKLPSKNIISYLESHKDQVKSDSYICSPFKSDIWIPLIQFFCTYSNYKDVVRYLLYHGADPKKLPDAPTEEIMTILFTCHICYLPSLIKLNCNCETNQINCIRRSLVACEWQRLQYLKGQGKIDSSLFIKESPDIIYEILNAMKQYLVYCYNVRQDIVDKTQFTDDTICNFIKVIKLLLSWGAIPTTRDINYCIEYYLYEFLSLPSFKLKIQSQRQTQRPVPHEDKDPLLVAMHRPLLNDGRYTETCSRIKVIYKY